MAARGQLSGSAPAAWCAGAGGAAAVKGGGHGETGSALLARAGLEQEALNPEYFLS